MIKLPWRPSLILGFFIGFGLLILLFSQLSLRQAWQTLSRLNGLQLLLPLLVTSVGVYLRPWRWQAIFPPDARPGFKDCFSVLWISNMTNNILPGRGGDLLRCFLAARQTSLAGASLVLATLGLEKVLDGLVLLTIVLFSFCFFSPPQWLGRLGLLSGIVFIGTLAVLLLLRYRTKWFFMLMRLLFRKIHLESLGEKVVTIFARFVEGLNILNSIQQVTRVIGLTILVWVAEAALIWGLASALQLSLPLFGAIIVSAVLGIGLMIPAAPGSIGTYEFFSVAALRLFGIRSESALALTLVMHAWSILATTGVGLAGLWISGIRFSQLIKGRP